MDNVIEKIINGYNLEEIIEQVIDNIYLNGPINQSDLEILTYFKYFQNEFFKKYENDIIQTMGLFYKDADINSLEAQIMQDYKDSIIDTFGQKFTPIQSDMYANAIYTDCFSFSSGTSTGKSFVFNEIIKNSDADIVVIVPSRALINEYMIKINGYIKGKEINVLPFVDFINCKFCKRNIFVLTPERAKELFKYKEKINLDYILFDEAQLSDEETSRSVIFDSIVRRVDKYFPMAKKLFAHPFIENPEAQLVKNNINKNKNISINYKEKNVGQMYISYIANKFYCFGLDKSIMGNKKIGLDFNPIAKVIKEQGTVLIYTHKSKIYNGKIFKEFEEYIELCNELDDSYALKLVDDFKKLIGGSDDKKSSSYSNILNFMKKGIILHHGSLPLQARMIIEEFTKKGYCKLCFSTSTLVQGINMPFDLVLLDSFEGSKPLSIKNIIGRAGRSTPNSKFDYGIIVVKDNNKSQFRNVMNKNIYLKQESILDTNQELTEELNEYRDAVKNNSINDEYNLTNKEVERISNEKSISIAKEILDLLFINDNIISGNQFTILSSNQRNEIYKKFQEIYKIYLNNRELSSGEKGVISTAIRIMIWQIQGKTFKQIVGYRYSYLRKNNIIRPLLKKIKESANPVEIESLKKEVLTTKAEFTTRCLDIPNKELPNIPLFDCMAYEIDYDLLVYDTYDYVDKIIGFKLKDIYFSLFDKLYMITDDIRAKKLSMYIKYGTIDEKEIYLLRYGYSFETIDWLKDYVKSINENEIIFQDINNISPEMREEIGRYL